MKTIILDLLTPRSRLSLLNTAVLIALWVFLAAITFAATPVITITDDATCLVDGQNFGQPQDVIVNNPQLASAVGNAWKAYRAKVVSDASAAVAATTAKAQTDAADLVALVAVLRKLDLSKLPPELAEVAATILGSDKDRKAAALQAEKAAIEAKIAALP